MPARKHRGQSLIEVTALIAAAIPLVLTLLDGSIYLSALSLNDAACREVVRAVSASAPAAIQKDSPLKNAIAALNIIGSEHGFVRVRKEFVIKENIAEPLPTAPFGGPVNGEVTVTTTADVTLPLYCNVMRAAPVVIEAHHTCAFNWTMPSVAAAQNL